MFRGGPAMNGYSGAKLPENPRLLWSYRSEARTSASPVVKDGTVYWCDKRGKIHGVDNDGKPSFSYDFATAVESTPAIFDSVIFLGRIDGFVSAISLKTAHLLWEFETDGQVSASPNRIMFEGNMAIVVGSYDHFLYCLDHRSGKPVKKFESQYYINGAAAVCGSYLIFGGCDEWVRIIDTASGTATDSLKLDAYIPGTPAVWDHFCYVADYAGNIHEVELSQGKIVAHQKIVEAEEEHGATNMPAVSKKHLYSLVDGRNLGCIERGSGKTKWKTRLKGEAGESSPVVCYNKVLCCTKSGIVSIMETTAGKVVWEYDTGEAINASPAVVAGRFYVLTAKGTLFCFGEF